MWISLFDFWISRSSFALMVVVCWKLEDKTKPVEVSTSTRCFASLPFLITHTLKELPNKAEPSPFSAISSFVFDFSEFLGLFLWATFDFSNNQEYEEVC